ncbi:MAG: hypothetical protein ACYC33_03210 [Thermoleophilia bacterium]
MPGGATVKRWKQRIAAGMGAETIRMGTMVVVVALGVAVVALAIWIHRSTGATIVAVLLSLLAFVVLAVGKVLADRALIGISDGRRKEDSDRLMAILSRLTPGWWVLREPVLAGTVVETLVMGPRGVFVVEVFRWLTRDTGAAFHEKVADDLSTRCADVENLLVRLTNLPRLTVQPVFFCVEQEGVRVGDLVLDSPVQELRVVGKVAVVTSVNLEAFLRAATPHPGLRARPLDPADLPRLVRLVQTRSAGG